MEIGKMIVRLLNSQDNLGKNYTRTFTQVTTQLLAWLCVHFSIENKGQLLIFCLDQDLITGGAKWIEKVGCSHHCALLSFAKNKITFGPMLEILHKNDHLCMVYSIHMAVRLPGKTFMEYEIKHCSSEEW